jgi:hypothetical protein
VAAAWFEPALGAGAVDAGPKAGSDSGQRENQSGWPRGAGVIPGTKPSGGAEFDEPSLGAGSDVGRSRRDQYSRCSGSPLADVIGANGPPRGGEKDPGPYGASTPCGSPKLNGSLKGPGIVSRCKFKTQCCAAPKVRAVAFSF